MPKKEVPLTYLQQYIPAGVLEPVVAYLKQYKVHLTITRERKSVLGDYRHRYNNANHRISINGNLNSYAFLITFLHELAHLLVFEQFGNKVQAHGKEWKNVFAQLLRGFINKETFPQDIKQELQISLNNPAASSCAEEGLMRVLRRYNEEQSSFQLVEELLPGTLFRIKSGQVFKKEEKLRKRFKCTEVKTGKMYLFSPVYEVEPLS